MKKNIQKTRTIKITKIIRVIMIKEERETDNRNHVTLINKCLIKNMNISYIL